MQAPELWGTSQLQEILILGDQIVCSPTEGSSYNVLVLHVSHVDGEGIGRGNALTTPREEEEEIRSLLSSQPVLLGKARSRENCAVLLSEGFRPLATT